MPTNLTVCAKARAALQGRFHATIDDIRHVARPVLRHRIVTTFHAEAEGIDPDKVIAHLLGQAAPLGHGERRRDAHVHEDIALVVQAQ